MKARKTAREKLEKGEAEVKDTPKGKMLIPRPLDVDALMRKIGRGKLATTAHIRERLARDCGADFACPMVSGIFIRIAAEAAEEDLGSGKKDITPYWRVIKPDGSLNEKFPGGVAAQAAHLKEEGHAIEAGKGNKPHRVSDFEKHLQKL